MTDTNEDREPDVHAADELPQSIQGLGITHGRGAAEDEDHSSGLFHTEPADSEDVAEMPGQFNASPDQSTTLMPSISYSYIPRDTNVEGASNDGPHLPKGDALPEGASNVQTKGLQTPQRPTASGFKSSYRSRSGTVPRFSQFKDFAVIKNTPQRVEAYNKARNDFAEVHTGLNEWLVHIVKSNPDLAQSGSSPYRANTQTGGLGSSVRGKLQAKLTRLGPTGQSEEIPEDDTATAYPSTKARQASGTQPGKGKDRLHLGVAKGLLAKGRNKLKGGSNTDKVE